MDKLDRKSMVTQLLLLMFIINAIVLTIFTVYFIRQNNSFNKFQIEEGLEKISQEKAQVVNLTMKQVENEIENIALWVEEILFTDEDYELPQGYVRNQRGVLVRDIQVGARLDELLEVSNIYYPENVELSQKAINQIVSTESLDKVFADIRRRNPYVQWVYFTTEEGLMRILPYSDTYTVNENLDSNQDQREAPFYRFATPEANPSREIVWTKPYYDYMGTGWMVTCSYPVYDKDDFIGVICIDVGLDTLKSQLLADFRLGESGFAFLISNTGDIIYHPNHIPVEGELGDILHANLLDDSLSSQYQDIINSMIDGNEWVASYYYSGDSLNRMIAFSQIPRLGWSLGIEIQEQEYISKNNIFTYNFISILALGAFFAFIGVFVFRQYSRPILQLTQKAQKISMGDYEDPVKIKSNFTEIKILSDAFQSMSTTIETYTKNLKQRNKQIETIFNSIGGLLMVVSPNYEIITINEKGLRKFGRDILGTPCYEAIASRDKPCMGCKIINVADIKNSAYSQIALDDKIYQNSYYSIINNNEEIEEIIVYSVDVTEQVTMEKELNQSEKMAGIGQISSAIAHELKNPLTIIKGSAYVLAAQIDKDKDKALYRNVEIIDETVNGAEKVIYSLLEFSSKSEKDAEMLELSKIIQQILLFQRKTTIRNDIDLSVNFKPDPLIIYSNPDGLKHIFLNLISNAIDALSDGGRLSIHGSYIKDGQEDKDDKVKIEITDTGCGIPKDIQKEIFNPFFSTKKNRSGTGLGLWITKRSIIKLGGQIQVDSTPGTGTTVTVIFPYKNYQEEDAENEI